MKVIGQAGASYHKRFIVEITEDELKDLTGQRALEVGMELKVSELFKRLNRLDAHKGTLAGMAAQLRSYATLLEATDPLVRAQVEPHPDAEGTEI